MKRELKIVILGAYHSGKTTTLEKICKRTTKVEYNGTTIALDYGNTILDGMKIHIFGSPGQDRFKFMREILSKGLNGAIVVVDSTKGPTNTDAEIIKNLNENRIPYVIFANKQDLKREDFDIEDVLPEVPIIPTVAKDGTGIHQGLELLLELIQNRTW